MSIWIGSIYSSYIDHISYNIIKWNRLTFCCIGRVYDNESSRMCRRYSNLNSYISRCWYTVFICNLCRIEILYSNSFLYYCHVLRLLARDKSRSFNTHLGVSSAVHFLMYHSFCNALVAIAYADDSSFPFASIFFFSCSNNFGIEPRLKNTRIWYTYLVFCKESIYLSLWRVTSAVPYWFSFMV